MKIGNIELNGQVIFLDKAQIMYNIPIPNKVPRNVAIYVSLLLKLVILAKPNPRNRKWDKK